MKMSKIPQMIMSLILTASLILGLVMIPGFNSHAASYPATTSFTYTYDGYDYQFYFSGEVDSPQDYVFDSSVLDYLINKASEGLNLSISSGLGAKIDWLSGIVLNSVFDFYRNFVVATDKVISDWIVWTDIYGFSFEFTGLDSNYPGYETYGSAYGWRFTGWLGEKIDLVLDSQGMLYGSNPIGNYTFSEDQQDFGIWSIHQHDGDDIWMPTGNVFSFGDLKPPYFEGNTLVFYAYNNGVEHRCTIPNFERCLCVYFPWNVLGQTSYPGSIGFIDYRDNGSISNSDRLYIDGVLNNLGRSGKNVTYTYKGNYLYQHYMLLYGFNDWQLSINLPMYQPSTSGITNFGTVSYGNTKGILSNQPQYATCELLYLDILTTSPLPDPIVLPVDDPVPVTDIQPDPVDFTPDPDDDPDPVPGIDYPVDPIPFPVPPLPPIVSGNDDLWPDLNDVFTIEADLDGFLGGLSNFQFTPLRTLVDGFTSALTWVSTIMMLLYDGSDFSILFVVLSVFFIAAALLGIYKWWTR